MSSAMNEIEKQSSPPELANYSSDSNLSAAAREDGVSAAYEAKSHLVNEHLQNEIGFGRYQLQLFILTGLGWAADNIWLQGVAIILPQIQSELNPVRVEFTTLSLYVGLILGATTWGILADLIGRRLSFNITLFIAGVFGVAAGGANSFVTLASLIACVGFGVGGNLPVDGMIITPFILLRCIALLTKMIGAIFLEFIPKSHQWLLTLLSAWWALGQLFASLVAWPLIINFSCASADDCPKSSNMGWRYTLYVLGGVTLIMWICRYVIFDLQESPKYLLGKGQDLEAIKVLQHIASVNGRTISLTVEDLQKASGNQDAVSSPMTTAQLIKQSFSSFSLSHVEPLFSTKRLAINTTITILLWGLIGLAYPLFNGFITLYLTTQVPSDSSISTTYRNYSIISVMGIPGSIIACLVVDWSRKNRSAFAMGGRKVTMAVSTALTGVFLFLFTTRTLQMYGVLYAYTPEVFPAPHRGTGDALCSAFNRITGILAPVIKIVTTTAAGTAANGTANGPIFVSASLFLVAAILMLFLPIETAGKAAL
ncbi:MFS general substrate transporter [Lentinula raphanica]|uniref:MFS general substrate transporter n=1 Tax=Lentinula raphanica TaxID=153919 RepID=A0AA38P974_9AGAR|nr:MFS general substrate transporter [Lentinula raphanica]